MGVGEQGESLGLTVGDVTGEVSGAIAMLFNTASIKRLDGDGWAVYKVGSNVIRADLNISKLESRADG